MRIQTISKKGEVMTDDTWIGVDSVTIYELDPAAPEIEEDKPPDNRYGEPVEVKKV